MNRVVVLETVRRHFTNILIVTFVGLILILGLASSQFDTRMWPPFLALLTFGAGAALIGPEFSSGTLQLILVKPINRSVYLVSRVTGVVAFIAIVALLAVAYEVLGQWLWGGGESIGSAAIALVNHVSMAALVCSVLAFFGTFLRAYFNIALYFLIQIALSVTQGMLRAAQMAKDGFLGWVDRVTTRFPIIPRSIEWVQVNLFPDAPPTLDHDWLLMVWSNALVVIVLACFVFRNREVPYGAD